MLQIIPKIDEIIAGKTKHDKTIENIPKFIERIFIVFSLYFLFAQEMFSTYFFKLIITYKHIPVNIFFYLFF